MKKRNNKSTIRTSLIVLFFAIAGFALAQAPPPDSHGAAEDQAGGGAPIGSGLVLLVSLGAAYGGRKFFTWKQADIA